MDVTRLPVRLAADSRRVVAHAFNPGGTKRIRAVVERVCALPEAEVGPAVTALVADYRLRHKDIRGIFRQNLATVLAIAGDKVPDISEERRLLL
ncbi:hypothetical protein BH09MYX1_BH09MYX1_20100 [soil metagenome]